MIIPLIKQFFFINEMKDSGKSIFKYVVLGFVITALLVGAKILIEHTSWGHRAELWAFELLQGRLSAFNPKEQLPVVVVDVSNIGEGKDKEIIDLEKLKEVIRAIAEGNPRVIAVDAVVTPELENPDDDSEAERQNRREQRYFDFLNFCQQKIKEEKGIPIFLAVGDRVLGEPKDWLGDEKYKELAATIIIPRQETTRIPIWFRPNPKSEKLFSLSASLAKAYQKIHLPDSLAWAVESVDEEFPGTEIHLEEDMEYASALVNYSKLEAIKENKLLTISQTSIKEASEKFYNRMVILGDGTTGKAVDNYIVIGRNEVIPGVYIHASAAYTFAREPMYEFKCWVRLALDFALSALVIFSVAIFRWRHLDDEEPFSWEKLQNRLVLLFLLVTCILAFLLVRYTGILWLDFLLVMIALWLHPKIEHKISNWKRSKPSTQISSDDSERVSSEQVSPKI